MQMMPWILFVAVIWLVPVVACAFEQGLLGRTAALLAQWWRGRSVVGQMVLAAFVAAFVIRGGAKQARSDGKFGIRSSESGIDGDDEFGIRSSEFGIGDGSRTNGVWFTDFAVVATNGNVAFEVAWANEAFDEAESRGLDLFMSTNLIGRWMWLNRWSAPATTNQFAFTVGREDVDISVSNVFSMAFGRMALFKLGLDVDSDNDGLTDAYERLVVGSSPERADSDGDGILDAVEFANGLNPNDAHDAYHDFDGDGIPNLYECMNGGDPYVEDAWRVNKIVAGDVSAVNGVTTLGDAFARATPYCVIEVADGVHSGSGWTWLELPDFPILLTSANGGRSRGAVIHNKSDSITLLLDNNQTRRTIIQGLRIVLSKNDNFQTAFWVGANTVFNEQDAAAVFRNIDVYFQGNAGQYFGWYFMQNHDYEESVISGCRVNALGTTASLTRGVCAIQPSPLLVENCTFVNFPADSAAVLCQSVAYDQSISDGVPIDVRNCHFDESFTNAYALARFEESATFDVTLANSVLPPLHDLNHLPDNAYNLFHTNAPIARAGFIMGESFLQGRSTTALYSVCDIDGEPWRDAPSIGADEYYTITNLVVDTDGDGLTDWRERHETGTDPFVADCDLDGRSDGDEVSEGTDPLDAQSYCCVITMNVPCTEIWPGETNHLVVTSSPDGWVGEIESVRFVGGYTNTYDLTACTSNVYFKYNGTYVNPRDPTVAIRKNYNKFPIGGDSGSPFFFLAGNVPVLVGAAWHYYDTSFIGFYAEAIQNKMDKLLPSEQSRHRLQFFDFSSYSQIIPERVAP